MVSKARLDELETVSPELVLVSPPEVARLARDELPEPPFLRHVVSAARPTQTSVVRDMARDAARVREHVPEPPPYPRVVVEEPRPPRERNWRRIALACTVVAGILAGAMYLTVMPRHAQRAKEVAVVTALRTATTPANTQQATPNPRRRPTKTARPASTSPRPAANQGHAVKPKETPAPKPKKPASAAQQASDFVPARTWTWVESKGAHAYEMRFELKGYVVFRVRTTQPRVVLPRSFRFHAGIYRWIVQRIPATTNGRRIVDSTFVLTAATAARVNG
jgi:hypothetical protein